MTDILRPQVAANQTEVNIEGEPAVEPQTAISWLVATQRAMGMDSDGKLVVFEGLDAHGILAAHIVSGGEPRKLTEAADELREMRHLGFADNYTSDEILAELGAAMNHVYGPQAEAA